MVCLVSTDGVEIEVSRAALEHFAPRLTSTRMWEADRWHSAFAAAPLRAFSKLCGLGTTDDHHATMSCSELCAALGPISAYGAHGLERCVQRMVLWADAHRVPFPPYMQLRLCKTVGYTTWCGVPYMWKVAVEPHMPGFRLYEMSATALLMLAKASHDSATCTSAARLSLKHRLVSALQRQWRRRHVDTLAASTATVLLNCVPGWQVNVNVAS